MRKVAILSVLTLIAATPSPTPPTPEPVFELHRTVRGAHISPGATNPLFALIIGSDIREGDPAAGRADSLHVVAVDPVRGRGTIVGIPRDSFVPIPGRGSSKINAALSSGGPERMVQTVEALSGLPIHYWALTEFSRFRELVDRLGRVEVDVPYRMADRFSGAFFDPGKRRMNGTEALAFARARMGIPGGDFGRSENHGRLLLAGIEKFSEDTKRPLELFRYLSAFNDLVATDVPLSDLIELALIGRRLEPDDIANVVLPGSTGSAGGASVVFLGPSARQIFDAIRDDAVL